MYSFLTWITCQWCNKNQPHHKNLKCNSKLNSKYGPSFSRRCYSNLSLSCMLLKVIKHTWLSLLFTLLFKIWYVIFIFGMSSFSCLLIHWWIWNIYNLNSIDIDLNYTCMENFWICQNSFSFVNFNLQVVINWILQHLPFIFSYFMVVEGPRRLSSLVLWLFGTFVLGGAPKFETSFVNLIMPSFSSIKKINLWQNMSLKFNIVFFLWYCVLSMS